MKIYCNDKTLYDFLNNKDNINLITKLNQGKIKKDKDTVKISDGSVIFFKEGSKL
jgi:hypothetical protein